MALQMIEVIICSHEAVASGTAKCLLLGLGVKTRFLIWFPTEKLKKDKWNSFGRPTAAWEPSHESAQSLCRALYSQCDPSLLILFCLWLYNFLKQTVCHQTQSSICNQQIRQKLSLIQVQHKQLYCTLIKSSLFHSELYNKIHVCDVWSNTKKKNYKIDSSFPLDAAFLSTSDVTEHSHKHELQTWLSNEEWCHQNKMKTTELDGTEA